MTTPEYKEKAGSCAACGNSPVYHGATYIFQTWNVYFGYGYKRLAHFSPYLTIAQLVRQSFQWVQHIHYTLATWMGIVTFHTDVKKSNTYRSQVIWEEALKRDIAMEQIYVFGKPMDLYRAKPAGGGWFYFESLPVPPWSDQSSYAWIDDKYLLKEAFNGNIAVPQCFSVTSVDAACKAFAKIGGTVIVKPQIGSRGRHTTTHIRTESDLITAFHSAQILCRFVVIEEHLNGPVCRATVVGGTLAGFFAAYAPSVVGNGTMTISELIALKNAARAERIEAIVLTEEQETFLQRAGYTKESVIDKGEVVMLSQRTGRLFGGETEELLSSVHPELKSAIEKVHAILNAPIVGYDLIIGDPKESPSSQRWGIIEANSLPFIDLHYLPLRGNPSPVAASVWDLWK